MAKGISIPIASDTREFSQGIATGVIKPLEGVEEALDDVAKGGDDAGKALEHSLDGARRETSEYKRDQQSLGQVMQQTQREGTQALELNSGQRTKLSRAAIKQAGAAAKQSLSSDLASMDGTAQGALSAVGNTAGGILASFGPIGAGIGVAVGVAVGLVGGLLSKGTENTKKFKAAVKELSGELINTKQAAPSLEYLNGQLRTLATATEDGEQNLEKLRETADAAGSSYRDLAQAYIGNSSQLDDMITRETALKEALEDRSTAIDTTTNAGIKEFRANELQVEGKQRYIAVLQETADKTKAAEKAELDYINAGGDAMQAKADRIKTINAAYDESAGAVDKYLDKEKNFDAKKFIKGFKAREKALQEYQSSLASSGLSPEAKEFIDSQGFEAANSFLAGYKKASPKHKKDLNRIWSEAAKENSGEYLTETSKGLAGKTLKAPRVALPTVDVVALLRKTQDNINARPPLKITVETVDRNGEKIR